MGIGIHTMYDVLYALAVVVGIAVAITLAMVAAGSMFERDKVSAAELGSASTITAQQPSHTSARERVLR